MSIEQVTAGKQASIAIRDAAEPEHAQLADIVQRAYHQFAEHSQAEHWSAYEAATRTTIMSQPNITRIVAQVEGKIAGVVLFCPPQAREIVGKLVSNPYPEFRLLAVDPDCRDMGIGAILIAECERRAKIQGYSVLSLHTTILMQTAMHMYERRGYSRFADIDFSPYPGFVVVGYKKDL